MKKALALVVLIVTPCAIFAQGGTVVIENRTGLVEQWTSPSDPTLISVPKNGGYVELIAAATGSSLTPLFTGTTFNYPSESAFLAANAAWAVALGVNPGPIGLGPGLFTNGISLIGNIAEGASADYILLGWTGTSTSVDAAIAATLAGQAMFGESAIATTQTGAPFRSPVSLSGTFQGMTLAPAVIPEPTTVLLAGLGALLLLLFRRRG